jgi:hypothetical protein
VLEQRSQDSTLLRITMTASSRGNKAVASLISMCELNDCAESRWLTILKDTRNTLEYALTA